MKTITKSKPKRKLDNFFKGFGKNVIVETTVAPLVSQESYNRLPDAPKCSNCNLAMNLIENEMLWFCPLGCESRPNGEKNDVNLLNNFADLYNAKLEQVLNDEHLYADFETICDEQEAILIIDGGMSEMEAKLIVEEYNNLRRIVFTLTAEILVKTATGKR